MLGHLRRDPQSGAVKPLTEKVRKAPNELPVNIGWSPPVRRICQIGWSCVVVGREGESVRRKILRVPGTLCTLRPPFSCTQLAGTQPRLQMDSIINNSAEGALCR